MRKACLKVFQGISKKYKSAPVLVHEELWRQRCLSTYNGYEHQQALSGIGVRGLCEVM